MDPLVSVSGTKTQAKRYGYDFLPLTPRNLPCLDGASSNSHFPQHLNATVSETLSSNLTHLLLCRTLQVNLETLQVMLKITFMEDKVTFVTYICTP